MLFHSNPMQPHSFLWILFCCIRSECTIVWYHEVLANCAGQVWNFLFRDPSILLEFLRTNFERIRTLILTHWDIATTEMSILIWSSFLRFWRQKNNLRNEFVYISACLRTFLTSCPVRHLFNRFHITAICLQLRNWWA